jgi:putative PIN family toxin of toxin-antitoxin system
LFSQELLDEFVEVARRPKFRKYFSLDDLQELLSIIGRKAEFIMVEAVVDLCRDPKDNFLLALCKDGRATHLLTGDKDLLTLRKYQRTEILTISRYMSSLAGR